MLIGVALFARSERLTTLEARERLVSLEQSVQSAQVTFLDVINDRPGEQATLDATLQRAITTLDPSVDQYHRRKLSADESRRANTARFEALFLQAARFSQQAELETDEAKRTKLLREAEIAKQQAVDSKPSDDATSHMTLACKQWSSRPSVDFAKHVRIGNVLRKLNHRTFGLGTV